MVAEEGVGGSLREVSEELDAHEDQDEGQQGVRGAQDDRNREEADGADRDVGQAFTEGAAGAVAEPAGEGLRDPSEDQACDENDAYGTVFLDIEAQESNRPPCAHVQYHARQDD